MMLVPTLSILSHLSFWFYSPRTASFEAAKRESSREKADLEKKLKAAEEITKRAIDEAKAAKDEAKRLKKELEESAADLERSKEHSQKVENHFREVVGKLSGNLLSPFLSKSFPF